MLLGQRLIQSGLISVEDLQTALKLQLVQGGRIGSALLRRGLVDIDALATILAEHVDAPAAKLKHFEGADAEALAAIPGTLAAKHRAFPLALVNRTGRELLVAMRDPQDVSAIDELAFVAGCRIRTFVAPELCILRYIERGYGIRVELDAPPSGPPAPRSRERRRGASDVGLDGQESSAGEGPGATGDLERVRPSESSRDGLPMLNGGVHPIEAGAAESVGAAKPRLSSGLLPHPATWMVVASPAPPPRTVTGSPVPGQRPQPRALNGARTLSDMITGRSPGAEAPPLVPAVDFVGWGDDLWLAPLAPRSNSPNSDLPAPEHRPTLQAPPPIADAPGPAPAAAPQPAAAPISKPELRSPVGQSRTDHASPTRPEPAPVAAGKPPARSLEDTLAAIERASTRDEIGVAILAHLRPRYAVGLLLIIKGEIALGWMGFGPALDSAVIETLAVPLSAPSVLGTAFKRAATVRCSPAETAGTAQSHFYHLLKATPPSEATVAPIRVKDRVVNLIYAHPRADATPPPEDEVELDKVAGAAAESFVRIIKNQKASAAPPPR